MLFLVFVFGCNQDTKHPNILLQGKIGNEEWTYKYAKVVYNSFENLLETELYGTNQKEVDPCQIPISIESHLSLKINNTLDYYQIPADVTVRFEQKGTDNISFTATFGFIEITSISGGRIVGYLHAGFDEANIVEGNFVFDRCR